MNFIPDEFRPRTMKQEVLLNMQRKHERLVRENHRIRIILQKAEILRKLGRIEPGSNPTEQEVEEIMIQLRRENGWN